MATAHTADPGNLHYAQIPAVHGQCTTFRREQRPSNSYSDHHDRLSPTSNLPVHDAITEGYPSASSTSDEVLTTISTTSPGRQSQSPAGIEDRTVGVDESPDPTARSAKLWDKNAKAIDAAVMDNKLRPTLCNHDYLSTERAAQHDFTETGRLQKAGKISSTTIRSLKLTRCRGAIDSCIIG